MPLYGQGNREMSIGIISGSNRWLFELKKLQESTSPGTSSEEAVVGCVIDDGQCSGNEGVPAVSAGRRVSGKQHHQRAQQAALHRIALVSCSHRVTEFV